MKIIDDRIISAASLPEEFKVKNPFDRKFLMGLPKKALVEVIYKLRDAYNKDVSKRLTLGCRARFKKTEAHENSWLEYAGRECLLMERSSIGRFSVLILRKGKNVPLEKEKTGVIENCVAWVDEDDLEFVDANIDANMDFIDWYQDNRDLFCGDCLAWRPEQGKPCPNKDCPGRLYDEGICPSCRTPKGKRRRYCKECGFDWELGG